MYVSGIMYGELEQHIRLAPQCLYISLVRPDQINYVSQTKICILLTRVPDKKLKHDLINVQYFSLFFATFDGCLQCSCLT